MRLYEACNVSIWEETVEVHLNVDNHIQDYHLERYIVGYTFGNHVLQLRSCVAVKLNFPQYIRHYTSTNKIFEYSYPLIACDKLFGYESIVVFCVFKFPLYQCLATKMCIVPNKSSKNVFCCECATYHLEDLPLRQ